MEIIRKFNSMLHIKSFTDSFVRNIYLTTLTSAHIKYAVMGGHQFQNVKEMVDRQPPAQCDKHHTGM